MAVDILKSAFSFLLRANSPCGFRPPGLFSFSKLHSGRQRGILPGCLPEFA